MCLLWYKRKDVLSPPLPEEKGKGQARNRRRKTINTYISVLCHIEIVSMFQGSRDVVEKVLFCFLENKICSFFFFFLKILFIHERHREAETGGAGSMQGAQYGTQSGNSDHALSQRQTLNH